MLISLFYVETVLPMLHFISLKFESANEKEGSNFLNYLLLRDKKTTKLGFETRKFELWCLMVPYLRIKNAIPSTSRQSFFLQRKKDWRSDGYGWKECEEGNRSQFVWSASIFKAMLTKKKVTLQYRTAMISEIPSQ